MNSEPSLPPTKPTVLITGATGLLGRGLMKALGNIDALNTVGLGFRRSGEKMPSVDLRDEGKVEACVAAHKPEIIIHAAAERRPDLIEKSPDDAWEINVSSTQYLIEAAKRHGAWLLYISSDYVFDGTNPPYSTDAATNPLNIYGKTKLAGEKFVLDAGFAVLRVPLLYGSVEDWGESSVTEMVPVLLANIGKTVWFDNWAIRYPTHVDYAAAVCARLSREYLEGRRPRGIYHASGAEAFTKLEMAMAMAQQIGIANITLLSAPMDSSNIRPQDSCLDVSSIKRFNLSAPKGFIKGIGEILASCKLN
jgi:dTDP-4-dehydrorhamnose reductase